MFVELSQYTFYIHLLRFALFYLSKRKMCSKWQHISYALIIYFYKLIKTKTEYWNKRIDVLHHVSKHPKFLYSLFSSLKLFFKKEKKCTEISADSRIFKSLWYRLKRLITSMQFIPDVLFELPSHSLFILIYNKYNDVFSAPKRACIDFLCGKFPAPLLISKNYQTFTILTRKRYIRIFTLWLVRII